MESVLKCATVHKNSPSFVPLSRVGLFGALKGSGAFREVVEIIKVFRGEPFFLTVNS